MCPYRDAPPVEMTYSYYEHKEDGNNKWWAITHHDKLNVTTEWGVIGRKRTGHKDFDFKSLKDAIDFVNKKRYEKENKGYELVEQVDNQKPQETSDMAVKFKEMFG